MNRSVEKLGVEHKLKKKTLNSPMLVTFVSILRTSYSEMAIKHFVAALGVWMREGTR